MKIVLLSFVYVVINWSEPSPRIRRVPWRGPAPGWLCSPCIVVGPPWQTHTSSPAFPHTSCSRCHGPSDGPSASHAQRVHCTWGWQLCWREMLFQLLQWIWLRSVQLDWWGMFHIGGKKRSWLRQSFLSKPDPLFSGIETGISIQEVQILCSRDWQRNCCPTLIPLSSVFSRSLRSGLSRILENRSN